MKKDKKKFSYMSKSQPVSVLPSSNSTPLKTSVPNSKAGDFPITGNYQHDIKPKLPVSDDKPSPEGSVNFPPPPAKKEPTSRLFDDSNKDNFSQNVKQVAKYGKNLLSLAKEGLPVAAAVYAPFGLGKASTAIKTIRTAKAGKAAAGIAAGSEMHSLFNAAPGVVVNAATKPAVQNFATKVASKFSSPSAVAGLITAAIGASVGGKLFGDLFIGTEETGQAVSFVRTQAFNHAKETGNWSLYEEARILEDEVYSDNDVWDEIQSYIPWKNVADGVGNYVEKSLATAKIWDKMAEHEQKKQAEDLTDKDIFKIAADEEKQQLKSNADNYNEKRKQMLIWEREFRKQAQIEDSEVNAKERENEAAFWAKEAAKQRKLEAEDRKAIADFWSAYRKKQQEISNDNRPSQLNFGLL
jgi:hypothetical protein